MPIAFGPFTLDPAAFELRRGGTPVPVEPQVLELLHLLVANRDRLVTRDELVERVWQGRIVSEATISSRIKAARQAIGDDGTAQRLIRTVHGRGFRFVAPVDGSADAAWLADPGVSLAVPDDRPSLAVLPFRYLAADPGWRYLLAGLQEEISLGLMRMKSFLVVNSGSGARFGEIEPDAEAPDLAAIGARLGVRYLVTGSLRVAGEALRVTARLVEAATGAEVWADRFDGALADTFDVQDRITEAVIGALMPSILAVEADRVKRQRPADPGAYDRLLRALPDVWALEPTAAARAMAELDRTLAQAPDYALAMALLSWCHGQHAVYNWPGDPHAHKARALDLARQAAALDPTDALVLTLLATAECVAGDVPAAQGHIDRSRQIDPNCCWNWNRGGYIHCYLGDPASGTAQLERSLRLSPLDPLRHLAFVGLGLAGFVAGDYDEALAWIDRGLAERPNILWVHRLVAACAAMAGDADRARRSVAIVEGYAPGIRVADITAAIPHQVPEIRARYQEALTRAGFAP